MPSFRELMSNPRQFAPNTNLMNDELRDKILKGIRSAQPEGNNPNHIFTDVEGILITLLYTSFGEKGGHDAELTGRQESTITIYQDPSRLDNL